MGQASATEVAFQGKLSDEGRYEVQAEIAAGGMGAVFRVFDRVAGEVRALKRARLDGEMRRSAIEALEREYQVLASLDHPRIIRVFDYGMDDRGPFYTMELLEGQDLRRAAPMPFKAACLYLRDIATSLALLHGRRLIHRDLSPSNVRLTPDGHCKLLDFGALAGFGVTSRLVGTPPLVAPEALHGTALDQRTDLFALGALAYWLLTGRHAYPARHLSELDDLWKKALVPPSAFSSSVPAEVDVLVLALLRLEPLARPSSAAEVIARLNVIGDLPAENASQTARLAQSFFVSPRFTGRTAQMRDLSQRIDAAVSGRGSAVCIEAVPGMGRTRLLDEVAVGARVAGATVIAVDASVSRQLQGAAQALVARVFELLPEPTRTLAPEFQSALRAVGRRVEAPARTPPTGEHVPPRSLADFFAAISAHRPLAIIVDNAEEADDASHGLLASLASIAPEHPLLLIVSEAQLRDAAQRGIGSQALRRYTHNIELKELSRLAMLDLARSIFSDGPNLERFGEWLHERSAGSPLFAIEICRRLLGKGVLRYVNGLWILPTERPDAELPSALGDALSIRIGSLQPDARTLAERLSLQRDQPTLRLCTLLCADSPEPETRVRELLEELTRAGVLVADRGNYRFSSSALRAALLQGMTGERLEANHRRLGEAFSQLASADDYAMHIEAGFHFIQGDDEVRGADLIAAMVRDSAKFRMLVVNLYHAGKPVEAAYKVYRRHRRADYERMPLLAALAQTGYYEERYFGETYGDEALTLLEALSGLATARRLRPFLGNVLSLCIGVALAFFRFLMTPRTQRRYSFGEIWLTLFSTVVTLTGTAALSLDAIRAERITAVLAPLAFLPERLTPVGIYQFCAGLCEIPRENESAAYATFERLLQRFSNPRYYPTLPPQGRALMLAAVHFARGSFALFRADGRATLESADALDATGYKLYAMIASLLRSLYYAARGELTKAIPHRNQVELHAAHVGSVWQVETWEAAALILIHSVAIGDVVSATQGIHRLDALSATVPSLKKYARLAENALITAHSDVRYLRDMRTRYMNDAPRSYIGWAATQSSVIRSFNLIGDFKSAKEHGTAVLEHVTEADRELVALFLPVDIHMAFAEAGLGEVDAALTRLDRLIARFRDSDHPLLQGMLHETRAYICWTAKRVDEYEFSLAQVERWYRPTGNPTLIAKYERLADMSQTTKSVGAQATPAAVQGAAVNDNETTDTELIDVAAR
ncbi:MAG TPA: AAA family ATPase [Polyangiales bacterium]|nr:AAA family ATPase [Polyangiales bacterium]